MQVMELITGLRREISLTVLMVTRYGDRCLRGSLTLRDGALGQDLTQVTRHHARPWTVRAACAS